MERFEIYEFLPIEIKSLTSSSIYNLLPEGQYSKNIESLSSYIKRLANQHCVSVGNFTSKLLLPHLKVIHKKDYKNNIYRDYSYHLNGQGQFAKDTIHIIEKLSGRVDLSHHTMIKFHEIISRIKMLKNRKEWCPICFQEMRVNSGIVFEKLVWSLNHYDICCTHLVKLEHQCKICGKYEERNLRKENIGYCDYCHSWLGTESLNQVDLIKDIESIKDAKQIEELISYFISKESINRTKFISSMNLIADYLRGNVKMKKFIEDEFETSISAFQGIVKGTKFPVLKTLLKISSKLNLNIVQILDNQQIIETLHKFECSFYQQGYNYKNVKGFLERIIISLDYMPIGSIATQLKISTKTLKNRFPILIEEIKRNNKKYILDNPKNTPVYSQEDLMKIKNYLKDVLVSPNILSLDSLEFSQTIMKKKFPDLLEKIRQKNNRILQNERIKKIEKREISIKKYKVYEVKDFNFLEVQNELNDILDSISNEPKFIKDISINLGITHARLRRYFPDILESITHKNEEVLNKNRQIHYENCFKKLYEVINWYRENGIYPSIESLQKNLDFKINNPIILKKWREILNELGIQRRKKIRYELTER